MQNQNHLFNHMPRFFEIVLAIQWWIRRTYTQSHISNARTAFNQFARDFFCARSNMCCYYIVHINNNIRSQSLNQNQNQTDWLHQTGTELAIISVISKRFLLCFLLRVFWRVLQCKYNQTQLDIQTRTVDQILNLRSYAHSCPGKFFW